MTDTPSGDSQSPPYRLILNALQEGRVIPFLGSGASLGRREPPDAPWRQPLDAKTWNQVTTVYLPRAGELAGHLASMTSFPAGEPLDLTKVSQYYHVVGGRDALYRELRHIFARDHAPAALHDYLADAPVPLLIVTTNYDDLIERAFDTRGRPYDLVIHPTDSSLGDQLLWRPHGEAQPREIPPNKLDMDLRTTTVIYKMHGAVDRHDPQRDQYVITEDDYIDFLTRMTRNKAIPALFAEPFQQRHFLFLGYGLRDWNLRVVLNRIEKDPRWRKRLTSWAIQYRPTALERRFWQEHGVEVYDMTIEEFVAKLQAD